MDKLREIIKGTMVYSTNKARAGLFDYDQLNEQADMLTSAITKLFKERMLRLIPPERISTDRMGYTSSKDNGFNECIAELRNAINTEGEI
jgi:hypothetical protein